MKNILYAVITVSCGLIHASGTQSKGIFAGWFSGWANPACGAVERERAARVQAYTRAYRKRALQKYQNAVQQSDTALKSVLAAFDVYERANFGLLYVQFFASEYIVATTGNPARPGSVEQAQKRYDDAYQDWQAKREKVGVSEKKLLSKKQKLDALPLSFFDKIKSIL